MQDFRVATFLTVCRTLNYTRAAEELSITQPAVSQHIAHLEQAYGTPLFVYRGRRLSLTPAGALARDTLERMAHDERGLRERMARLACGTPRKLTVGLTLTAGEYVVAAPLADWLAAHPDVQVTIRSGGTEELLEGLVTGSIDCAFVEGFFDKSAYAWNTYRSERFVCVRSAMRSGNGGACRMEDLLGERLLVREPGSGTRAVLEHALAARNLTLDAFERVSVVESIDVIKVLVSRGVGISFLYEAAVRREAAEGTLCPIELADAPLAHDITFIRLKDSVFENEYRALFAEMRRSRDEGLDV